MNHSEEKILKLLAGKSLTDLTADELHIVNSWKESSDVNKGLLSALEFLNNNQALAQDYSEFDSPVSTNPSQMRWIVSAVALLLITLAIIAYVTFGKNEVQTAVQIAFLPDGTEIHLHAGTSMKIADGFNESNRTIELSGDAFFDVEHDEMLPFVIKSGGNKVEVLGTAFDIDHSENGLHVSVLDGQVKLSNQKGDFQYLTKNQSGLAQVNKVVRTNTFLIQTKLVTASYVNANLYQIFKDLQLEHGFAVEYSEEFAETKCQYNGNFENASLKEILDEFSVLFSLQYSLEDSNLSLFRSTCK